MLAAAKGGRRRRSYRARAGSVKQSHRLRIVNAGVQKLTTTMKVPPSKFRHLAAMVQVLRRHAASGTEPESEGVAVAGLLPSRLTMVIP